MTQQAHANVSDDVTPWSPPEWEWEVRNTIGDLLVMIRGPVTPMDYVTGGHGYTDVPMVGCRLPNVPRVLTTAVCAFSGERCGGASLVLVPTSGNHGAHLYCIDTVHAHAIPMVQSGTEARPVRLTRESWLYLWRLYRKVEELQGCIPITPPPWVKLSNHT
jgi:hypothetical protein